MSIELTDSEQGAFFGQKTTKSSDTLVDGIVPSIRITLRAERALRVILSREHFSDEKFEIVLTPLLTELSPPFELL